MIFVEMVEITVKTNKHIEGVHIRIIVNNNLVNYFTFEKRPY